MKRLIPLLFLAGCVGGPRPFVDARLMDHKDGLRRSSVDAGVSVPTKKSWVDIGVAVDFNFGGGDHDVVNDALVGMRVTWRGK